MAETIARHLRPKLTTAQWAVRLLVILASVAVLIWAWRKSDIAPVALYENRQNAVDFLFGRALSPEELERSRRQAEDRIEIMLREDARRAIRESYEARGEPLPPAGEMSAMIERRTAEREARLGSEGMRELVAERFKKIVRDKGGGFFPPETSLYKIIGYSGEAGTITAEGYEGSYVSALGETVAIAVWGTLLAVVTALPTSILAARRSLHILAPGEGLHHKALRWFSLAIVRRLFDACRGFNEFIMALIFVAIIGLGPFAGVLALFVHTFGVLGKVFSEAIETIDRGQVEGVASTGASGVQTVSFAVIPQIMPYVVSQTLLRFESNVRSATILGVCGAGGIGTLLTFKIGAYQYQEVATMMILIIIVVALIDFACGRVMKRFI